MKKGVTEAILLVICVSTLIYFLPFTGHDIFSVNYGGSVQSSVSGSGGFFSQTSPVPIPQSPNTPPPGGNLGGGIGGGIAGGGSSLRPIEGIEINTTNISLEIINNTNAYVPILIKNNKNESVNISVSQLGLAGIAFIKGNSTFSLAPGESRVISVLFVGPVKIGVYTGSLIIAGNSIPVSLDVREHLLLFDSDIQVLNKNLIVFQGDKLRTEVTLTPKGDLTSTDVVLNYTIKNSYGSVYYTHEETVLVKNFVVLNRNFDVGILPIGNYTINLDLIYSNGVAHSSAHFVVLQPQPVIGKVIYYLLTAILVVAIIIVIVLIRRSIQTRDRFYRRIVKSPIIKFIRKLFFVKG